MDDRYLDMNFAEFYFDNLEDNDTAKDDQYKTPLGSKDNSPNEDDSESIEVVETPSNTYRGPLQESTVSSASTNNADICVLDSHYTNENTQFLPDHDEKVANQILSNAFVENQDGDDVFFRFAEYTDKNEDFTLLQKPTKSRHICNCEESTEVLMVINSEYQEKLKTTYSGTDSDVEVLMSEEIVESDWSSGNGLEENEKRKRLVKSTINLSKFDGNSDEAASVSCMQQSCDANSFKTQSSTDFDISGEELLDTPLGNAKYDNLSREQLLELVKKQELCIQTLEDTAERYQKARQRLLEHVDALRLELNEISITRFQLNQAETK